MKHILLSLLTTLALTANGKVALVIGNSNYQHLNKLSSPSKDIPALASKLRKMNFEVVELYNQDEKSMKKAIKDFKRRLLQNPNAIALFYYSGHGSQAYGESYLIPIDGDTRDESDVDADGIKVETIAQKMATARTKANILFLDACRDVPTGTMGGTKGLGQVKRQPSSTLILYSTSKNRTAKDDRVFNRVVLSKLGLNSPFIAVANDISYTVKGETGGKQVPEMLSTGLPNIVLGGESEYVATPSGLKWITPTNKGVTWKKAKMICIENEARLPTIEELKKVVIDCGGILNRDWGGADAIKNRKNSNYKNCYKKRGFNLDGQYWSSTHRPFESSVRTLFFSPSHMGYDDESHYNYIRCVSIK